MQKSFSPPVTDQGCCLRTFLPITNVESRGGAGGSEPCLVVSTYSIALQQLFQKPSLSLLQKPGGCRRYWRSSHEVDRALFERGLQGTCLAPLTNARVPVFISILLASPTSPMASCSLPQSLEYGRRRPQRQHQPRVTFLPRAPINTELGGRRGEDVDLCARSLVGWVLSFLPTSVRSSDVASVLRVL